ncbi:MAG: hypothetical protein IVW53_10315 [Chloroflexi bacterium]|nr:hypothetical protein [Chloroflexota bacterium]
MPQSSLSPEPPGTAAGRRLPIPGEPERAGEAGEPGIIMGRPVEDRIFEAVETGLGMAAGLAIGTAVAGPIGAAVGGLAGTAVGLLAGEAIERAAGLAATTTDCGPPLESSIADAAGASSASPVGAVRAGPSRGAGSITYPTNYLLAIADTKTEVAAGVAALAGAGLPASGVVVIGGPGGEQFERLGARPGPLSRLVRMIQFTTMDQTPDFRAYEAALLDGRTVVGVRIDADHLPVARDVLLASGLHFLNFYGRWSTTEVSPWRGPELALPGYLRR